MKNHKVSIIIPVYNVADYLEKCIQSCIEQTFRDIEVLVVNDGSTDKSSTIIERFAMQDDRIVIVNKENAGLLLARKSGIEIAQGEYIFHLDGDDWIESDAIEKLYNKAIESEADIVYGNHFVVQTEGGINIKECRVEKNAELVSFLHFIIANHFFRIWGSLIRKSLYNNIFFPPANPSIGEDAIQTLQLLNKSPKITFIEDCLYNYIIRGSSIINKSHKRGDKEYDFSLAIDQMLEQVCFPSSVRNELICLALERLCIYISESGDWGKDSIWAKQFLCTNYYKAKQNRNKIYAKNKKVYLMLLLTYISPKLVQKLSSLNKILKV